MNLEPLLRETLDWRYRMIPDHHAAVTVGNIGAQGWSVIGDDLLFPAMVVRETALNHNLEVMSGYCREHGIELAPHGKTAMAPQLLARQIEAGAWGVTTANVSQARVFRHFGASKILIANQVVDAGGIAWLGAELDRDPEFEVICLVDSVPGIEILEAGLSAVGTRRRLPVLLELGWFGGRSGCRTEAEALQVARAVASTSHLVLTGVEGWEGAIGHDRATATIAAVRAYLLRVRALAERLAAEHAFDAAGQIILTAGGSAYFDQVAECFRPGWEASPLPVRVIIRSGCYATHDCGFYDKVSPLRGTLRPALEVWGRVLSRPEPELAICGFGRRDVSFDIALPTPLWVAGAGSGIQASDDALEVTALNDQHALVRVASGFRLEPGDLVGCGVTHPCTAFDKWPLVLVVDDGYRVVGAMRTFF